MKTHQPNRDMRNDDKIAGDLKTRMDKIKARYRVNQPQQPTGPATDFIT